MKRIYQLGDASYTKTYKNYSSHTHTDVYIFYTHVYYPKWLVHVSVLRHIIFISFCCYCCWLWRVTLQSHSFMAIFIQNTRILWQSVAFSVFLFNSFFVSFSSFIYYFFFFFFILLHFAMLCFAFFFFILFHRVDFAEICYFLQHLHFPLFLYSQSHSVSQYTFDSIILFVLGIHLDNPTIFLNFQNVKNGRNIVFQISAWYAFVCIKLIHHHNNLTRWTI